LHVRPDRKFALATARASSARAPLDPIVTPDRAIDCRPRRGARPPAGICWDDLTEEKIAAIPLLAAQRAGRAALHKLGDFPGTDRGADASPPSKAGVLAKDTRRRTNPSASKARHLMYVSVTGLKAVQGAYCCTLLLYTPCGGPSFGDDVDERVHGGGEMLGGEAGWFEYRLDAQTVDGAGYEVDEEPYLV
jgi:hypothetical protein